MSYKIWTDESFAVKMAHVQEMPTNIEEFGFTYRGWGLSESVIEHLEPYFDDVEDELLKLVIQCENDNMDVLGSRMSSNSENYPLYMYFMFQDCEMVVADDDGEQLVLKITAVTNQVEETPGIIRRFTAIVSREESGKYHIERGIKYQSDL